MKHCELQNQCAEMARIVREQETSFPPEVTKRFRNLIIGQWMREMDLAQLVQKSCAVCGQRRCVKDIKVIRAEDMNFRLLQNLCIPEI